jgi:hypothetical protein
LARICHNKQQIKTLLMNKKQETDQSLVKDKKAHRGYNEENPAQPEGPFKADSMEKDDQEKEPPVPKKVVKK